MIPCYHEDGAGNQILQDIQAVLDVPRRFTNVSQDRQRIGFESSNVTGQIDNRRRRRDGQVQIGREGKFDQIGRLPRAQCRRDDTRLRGLLVP